MSASDVVSALKERGWMLATAESCTGGLVAGAITSIAGSSAVLDCGYVTYSNTAKTRMLGVSASTILKNGAVSPNTAEAMARGALLHSKADIAVSTTGIAGPGGGSASKPVGLVYFACVTKDGRSVLIERRFGELSRDEIRKLAVEQALNMVLDQTRS